MPSGNPSGPSPAGTVTHGTCKLVQMKLNAGSPVQPRPFGAWPGADGVTSTSSPSRGSRKRRLRLGEHGIGLGQLGLAARQPEIQPFAQALADLLARGGEFPAQRAGALVVHHYRMRGRQGGECLAGSSRCDTAAPARPSAAVTRSSSTTVSGSAWSQVGERQMPMRGARSGRASGSPRSRPDTAPANSAQSATLARHDTNRIKTIGHDLHADPADRAEARLVANHPAIGRGADNAAGGLGAERQRKEPSATPAAEPLLEPPGVCPSPRGFAVGPGLRVANSVVTVLPITTPPAARVHATAAASARGRQPRQIGEPYSLGMSAVSSTSFTPTGRPCSGPGGAAAPARRACSGSR